MWAASAIPATMLADLKEEFTNHANTGRTEIRRIAPFARMAVQDDVYACECLKKEIPRSTIDNAEDGRFPARTHGAGEAVEAQS